MKFWPNIVQIKLRKGSKKFQLFEIYSHIFFEGKLCFAQKSKTKTVNLIRVTKTKESVNDS